MKRLNVPCPSRKWKRSISCVFLRRWAETSIRRPMCSGLIEKHSIENSPISRGRSTNSSSGNNDRRIFPYKAGGILVVSFGIFLFDLLTPFSWAVWLLYLLPLLIIFDSPHVRDPIYFGSLVSVLTVLGLVLSPTSVPLSVETLNRMLGLVVMWAFVVILMNRRRLREGMAVAMTERVQAEKGQAVAVAERQHVEERLASSTLRLEGIVQSAMDAILT